ncbi:hypothetical protein ABZ639_19565 [Saccharomonospora sp. NPDC006951]
MERDRVLFAEGFVELDFEIIRWSVVVQLASAIAPAPSPAYGGAAPPSSRKRACLILLRRLGHQGLSQLFKG